MLFRLPGPVFNVIIRLAPVGQKLTPQPIGRGAAAGRQEERDETSFYGMDRTRRALRRIAIRTRRASDRHAIARL
jgi:hypothetical protein